MKNIGEVPVEPDLLKLATELGFADLHHIDRDYGMSPLFYARWKGAPVGITQITGLAGHLGIAFYQGKIIPTPEEIIEGDFIHSGWDDILDTSLGDPAALLVIAKRCWIFVLTAERSSIGISLCQVCQENCDPFADATRAKYARVQVGFNCPYRFSQSPRCRVKVAPIQRSIQ